MLVVVNSLGKFHHSSQKREVTILTDDKPLVSISQEPLSKAAKWLKNILFCTQQYNYVLRYKPRKEVRVADTLLRIPKSKQETKEWLDVNNTNKTYVAQIHCTTPENRTMRTLAEAITRGWHDNKKALPDFLKLFLGYRDELTVQDGLIL